MKKTLIKESIHDLKITKSIIEKIADDYKYNRTYYTALCHCIDLIDDKIEQTSVKELQDAISKTFISNKEYASKEKTYLIRISYENGNEKELVCDSFVVGSNHNYIKYETKTAMGKVYQGTIFMKNVDYYIIEEVRHG